MQKTFVLGVGAQKSGTTWLYSYLKQYEHFNLGFDKEYHIWDAIYLEECKKFLIPKKILSTPKDKIAKQYRKFYNKALLQNHPDLYQHYFLSLLSDKCNCTADITPSYSGLPQEALIRIKQALESVGFTVKVIFLMRDPFERCWSAVRMQKRNGDIQGSDESMLANLYQTNNYIFRTSYQHTIARLENVFSPENIYYGIYEEMFSKEKIQQISEFLQLQPIYSHTEFKFNTTEKTEAISKQLKQQIIAYYADVYQYCNRRFPQTKTLWNPAVA